MEPKTRGMHGPLAEYYSATAAAKDTAVDYRRYRNLREAWKAAHGGATRIRVGQTGRFIRDFVYEAADGATASPATFLAQAQADRREAAATFQAGREHKEVLLDDITALATKIAEVVLASPNGVTSFRVLRKDVTLREGFQVPTSTGWDYVEKLRGSLLRLLRGLGATPAEMSEALGRVADALNIIA